MGRKKQQKQTVDPACEVLESVPLASISLEGLQRRAAIDKETVDEYAEVYRTAPDRMPPGKGVKDVGGVVHLWDGHHRELAADAAGLREMMVLVRRGTLADAEWLACSANKDQTALKRGNKDKRRAVEAALAARPDESDGLIAEHCGVSQPFVSKVRSEITLTHNGYESTTRTGKDGRTIDTTNIGKPAPLPESPGLDSPLSVAMHAQDEAAARKKGLDDVAGVIAAEKEAAIARVVSSGRTGIMEAVEHCRALGCEEEAERLLGALGGPEGEQGAEPEAPDEEEAEGEDTAVYDDAPPAEQPAPPVLCDCNRVPVPAHAREAFESRALFGDLCRAIDDVKRRARELAAAPAGACMLYASVEADLSNARRQLWADRPEHVCPYCKGGNRSCEGCKGRGWVTRRTFNGAPEAVKISVEQEGADE